MTQEPTVTRQYVISRRTERAALIYGTDVWIPLSQVTIVETGVLHSVCRKIGGRLQRVAELPICDVTFPRWLLRKLDA